MAPKLGAWAAARLRARQLYPARAEGFASAMFYRRVRSYIRRRNGFCEPSLIRKLRRGGTFCRRSDVNSTSQFAIAEYIMFSPSAKQADIMQLLLCGKVRGVFLDNILKAYDELLDQAIRLGQQSTLPRVMVIAPDNIIFSVQYV